MVGNFSSKCSSAVNSTSEFDHGALTFIVEGVLSSLVATVGISGNIASVTVLLRPDFKETFHKLLICLSIVDSVFILCATYTSWIRILQESLFVKNSEGDIVEGNNLHLVFIYCVAIGNWARVTSLLVTVAISIERYFGICFPLMSRVRGRRRVAVYLLPVLIFSFAFNFPKFLEITPAGELDFELSVDPFYNRVYKQYVELSVTVVVPLLLLLVFNLRIIYAVRCQNISMSDAAREKREQYLTYLLVSIVLVFLACHSLKFFLLFYKLIDNEPSLTNMDCVSYPSWMHVVLPLSHLLLVTNSSLNFLIYCFVGSKFRKKFRHALVSCCIGNNSSWQDRSLLTRSTELSLMLPKKESKLRNTHDDDSQYELHQSRDRILVKVKRDLSGDILAFRE